MHTHDRNLLFGVIALQMDFVSRDALIAGMTAWATTDKTRSLGSVLVSQGNLTEQDRLLIEPIVDRHVEIHGGDASLSLNSISDGPTTRELLDAVARANIADSPCNSKDTAPIEGGLSTVEYHLPVRRAGRFHVLRRHKAGGLGQVAIARDEELGREVALKEIKDQVADDPILRARFVVEAEINGNLAHPSIVPVYGKGEHANGRPYYAMQFVHGQTLEDAIKDFHDASKSLSPTERSLRLRDLINRFLAVCNAIEYAHARGVLHRDLKPSNVMCGRYGETFLIDWGLAKATGKRDPSSGRVAAEMTLLPASADTSDPTQHGMRIGTPRYMSPEACSGEVDRMGPQTDVYGLGATLYALLTGNPPIDGPLGEVYAKILRGEIIRPRQVKPKVDKALDAICMKALCLISKNRYSSAADLAKDLERWLADEPVSACPEPMLDRAARFARRHKTIVATLVALMFAVALGLIIDHYRVGRERDRANENFELARLAVKEMLFKIARSNLPGVPQATALRREVTDRAWTFTNQLLSKHPTDSEIRFDSAEVLREIAKVATLLGDFKLATQAYNRAIVVVNALNTEYPRNGKYLGMLAQLMVDSASTDKRTENRASARHKYEESLQMVERLSMVQGATTVGPNPRHIKARILADLASLDTEDGQGPTAIDRGVESCNLYQEILQEQPSLENVMLAAQARQICGEAYLQVGDLAAAEKWFSLCVALCTKGLTSGKALIQPNGPTFDAVEPNLRHIRSQARVGFAIAVNKRGNRRAEAQTAAKAAVDELSLLTTDHPEILIFRSSLIAARKVVDDIHGASR